MIAEVHQINTCGRKAVWEGETDLRTGHLSPAFQGIAHSAWRSGLNKVLKGLFVFRFISVLSVFYPIFCLKLLEERFSISSRNEARSHLGHSVPHRKGFSPGQPPRSALHCVQAPRKAPGRACPDPAHRLRASRRAAMRRRRAWIRS